MASVGRDPFLDQRRKVGGFLGGQLFKLAEKIWKIRGRAGDGRHCGFYVRGHDRSPAGSLGLLSGFFCDRERHGIELLLELLQGIRGDPQVGIRFHKGFDRIRLGYAYRFSHFQRSSIRYTGFSAVATRTEALVPPAPGMARRRPRQILPDSAEFSLPIRYILTELGWIVKRNGKYVL